MALRLPVFRPFTHRYRQVLLTVFCLVCLNFACPGLTSAQTDQACFPVWQGFSTEWTYPHSIRRFGSKLTTEYANKSGSECTGHCVNFATSGNGADQCNTQAYYSTVKSPLMVTATGTMTMELTGKEGEMIKVTEHGEVDFPSIGDPDFRWEVLLNGFDLRTPDGVQADQIQTLGIAIDSVWKDIPAKKLKFRVNAEIRFACKTMDCEPLNQVVDYELQIFWQAIGGPGFQPLRSSYGGGRSWEKQDTAPPAPVAKVVLLGDQHYRQATVGITGLHMQLDRPSLMLGWDSHFECSPFTNGLLTMLMRMDFVQNRSDMHDKRRAARKSKPRPAAKWNIKPHAGTLVWEMDVSLLQFEEATIED